VLKTLIEGRLTFTPKTDVEGEFYEITGVATEPEILEMKTLPKLASPGGTGEGCNAKLLGTAAHC